MGSVAYDLDPLPGTQNRQDYYDATKGELSDGSTYADAGYDASVADPTPPTSGGGETPPPEPEPVPATGATAGTPGTFTPDGAEPPADLAALQTLGALGQTTAWTEGQYVVLDDASEAYWDGTAWQTGRAPAPAAP